MISGARGRKDPGKRMLRHLFSAFLLWLVSKEPMHGYEIIRRIAAEHGPDAVGAGHVYPVLRSLMRSGFVAQERAMQGRRVRKVYRITPRGERQLELAREGIARCPLKRRFMREMSA